MTNGNFKRLSPEELKEVLLKNSKMLASEKFKATTIELCGQKKESKDFKTDTPTQKRSADS